jgi:hypothetical protein
MGDEENKITEDEIQEEKKAVTKNEVSKIPLNGVLEILADKVSRKAVIVAMAMVLIYLLAATPNVTQVMLFVGTIAGLAVFFTILQWYLDVREDSNELKKRRWHKDSSLRHSSPKDSSSEEG